MPLGYERVGNAYARQDFGELLLSLSITVDTRACQRTVHATLGRYFLDQGAKAALLIPDRKTLFGILGHFLEKREGPIRNACLSMLSELQEFRLVTVDGTFKFLMSVVGQRKHGETFRKIRDEDRGPPELFAEEDCDQRRKREIHAVVTLRSMGGCLFYAAPCFSESTSETLRLLRDGVAEHAGEVEFLCSDSPGNFDCDAVRKALPGLKAVGGDPLRRAYEMELCFGEHTRPVTQALHRVHAKFSAECNGTPWLVTTPFYVEKKTNRPLT